MAPIPQTHSQTQDCEKCFGGSTSFPSFVSFFDKNKLDCDNRFNTCWDVRINMETSFRRSHPS